MNTSATVVIAPRLDIIGPGRLARTLGAYWHRADVFEIGVVLGRSHESAAAAISAIGAGRASATLADLGDAGAILLAVPDDQIATVAAELAEVRVSLEGRVVFHCSGAKDSRLLAALAVRGARTASVHPLMSFAAASGGLPSSATDLGGALCAMEGDPLALETLADAFRRIGGNPIEIERDKKMIYHAGAVIASNYLVTLLAEALHTFELAGLERDSAAGAMRPLIERTLANFWEQGEQALTGPIARGDYLLVRTQRDALARLDAGAAKLYTCLADRTAQLAGRASPWSDEGEQDA